ncbi:MAG: type VI secretion system tip protein VgrG [Chitinophagales bacterium]
MANKKKKRQSTSDLPSFEILINGNDVSSDYQILALNCQKNINKIPSATVELIDNQAFEVSNSSDFIPGNVIEIKLGYRNDNSTIFKGLVIKQSLKTTKKNSILIIHAQDESVKLSVGRKNKYFYNLSDAGIFEEIMEQYPIPSTIASSDNIHQQMVQYYCTDWDFIVNRAECIGHLVIPNDGEITIGQPNLEQEPALSLTYGENIIDFNFEINAQQQFQAIESSTWDAHEQTVVSVDNEEQTNTEIGNLSSNSLSEVIGLEKLKHQHGGYLNSNELLSWSNAKMLRYQLSKVIGSLSTYGTPLSPGQILNIDGFGDRFNGNVYISGVNHTVKKGNWITDINIGLNSEFITSYKKDIQDDASAGLLPPISGLHIGKVSAIDNDPSNNYRIKIRLPMISNEDNGTWARLATLDAGNNRGSFFLPEIDDEVIVGFLNEDPRSPIIVGMVNSAAKPAPFQAEENNNVKGFLTREQLKLVFNDETKSILLESPNGNKISISEEEKGIQIKDEHGNYIQLNDKGISVFSSSDIDLNANGDINLNGTNIKLNAAANLNVEGAAAAEISSSGTTVVKGSLVQIN